MNLKLEFSRYIINLHVGRKAISTLNLIVTSDQWCDNCMRLNFALSYHSEIDNFFIIHIFIQKLSEKYYIYLNVHIYCRSRYYLL